MKSFTKTSVIAGICASFIFTGCTIPSSSDQKEVNGFKLDTYVTISAYDDTDESVLQGALELCDRYEKIFSMHDESSELWRLNHNETDIVSDELGSAIKKGLEMYDLSDGQFQISIGSVSGFWDFRSDDPTVPDEILLKEGLQYVDDSKISLTREGDSWKVVKDPNTVIDLGAVAKGYIADKIKEFLKDNGTTSAIINLGGNVCCIGDKNGTPFHIGIRKPFGELSDTVAVLNLTDMSLITSGISERYFEDESGKILHHILDPSTGYPYENGLWQVSIISKSSLDGDCLSTVCFTLGLDRGLELIENLPDTEAVFITEDGQLHYSSGAENYLGR